MRYHSFSRAIEKMMHFGQQSALVLMLVWIAALIATGGVIVSFKHAFAAGHDAVTLAALPIPQLQLATTPLAEADYKAIAKAIPVMEGIEVRADSNGISINAHQLTQFYTWRMLVDRVLYAGQGIQWDARQFCAGGCPGQVSTAYSILLSGNRNLINIK